MKESTRLRLILFAITLCVLASLGFARFAFGAILPFMRVGLNFDYQQTGLVASGIFLGYLLSSFVSGHLVLKFTAKRVIVFSLLLIILSMGMISFSNNLLFATIGSLLLGIGSGGANIPALGLIARWFVPNRRGMAMGIANSGCGIGMTLSGLTVPLLIYLHPESGWRYSWLILAVFITAILMFNLILLKNDPSEVGMGTLMHQGLPKVEDSNAKIFLNYSSVYKNKKVWAIGISYMVWGFSYIVFSTFLVDYLMTDVGFEKGKAGHYFAIAGFVSIGSGLLWGGISDRFGRLQTMSFVYFTQSLLLLLMVFTTNDSLLLLEVALYGLSLWAASTVTNAAVSEIVEGRLIPVAMGFLTLFFGIGQFISPIITGNLIDYSKNYAISFYVSAGAVLLGSFICLSLVLSQKKNTLIMIQNKIKSLKNLKTH